MIAFDPPSLFEAIDNRRRQYTPVPSLRAIARGLHLSQSTFTRLRNGSSVDTYTLVLLMDWLGVYDIRAFTTDTKNEQEVS